MTRSALKMRGFSLLEVMIALAIFGLMIVGVLAAQASVAATNKKAADEGQAIDLARCKMSELEEKLIRDGYPDLDDINMDVLCCEGTDTSLYTCETRVEKVTLPDPPSSSALSDGGGLNPLGSPSGAPGVAGAPSDTPFNAQLDFDGGLGNIASALGPQAAGGGAGGMLNMVMGFVYPTMKPLMENSIRRLTVTVHWSEGPNAETFTIVQYVTNPAKGGFMPGMMGPDGGMIAPGAATGTGTGSSPAGGAPNTGPAPPTPLVPNLRGTGF